MNTSDVLNKAADLIEQRGWADWKVPAFKAWGDLDPKAPVCIEGAVFAAAGFNRGWDERDCPAYQAVHSYLSLDPIDRLFRWNDAMDRTAAEVIEVLRACAVIEAAREEQDAAWATYAELVAP